MLIKNISFLFLLLSSTTSLMANGREVPIEECIQPRATAESSNEAIAQDCVTTCNLTLARLNMDRQVEEGKVSPSLSWNDWLWEFGRNTVQQYSPVQKGIDLQSFTYPVFGRKFDDMSNKDAQKLWCSEMKGEIDNHFEKSSWGISQKIKGCLKSLSLYVGCHDRCKEILNRKCAEL